MSNDDRDARTALYWELWAIEQAHKAWHPSKPWSIRVPIPSRKPSPVALCSMTEPTVATVHFDLRHDSVVFVSKVDLPDDLPPAPDDEP